MTTQLTAATPGALYANPGRPIGPRPTGAGLPGVIVVGLGVIAAPGMALSDHLALTVGQRLGLTVISAVICVVVAMRWSRRPIVTLAGVGAVVGVISGLVVNLGWGPVFGGGAPMMGDGCAGLVDPIAAEVLMRGHAVVLAVGAGVAIGALGGLTARLLRSAVRRLVAGSGRRHPADAAEVTDQR